MNSSMVKATTHFTASLIHCLGGHEEHCDNLTCLPVQNFSYQQSFIMPSAGRKGVVLMKQHFSYLCVQLHFLWGTSSHLPALAMEREPSSRITTTGLFCFPFVLREIAKHPTKGRAQQSKPACYTNREQDTLPDAHTHCMVMCVTLALEMQPSIPALQSGTDTSAGLRGVCIS